ncbi:hypothetical protein D9M69_427160 [compost metagenome]
MAIAHHRYLVGDTEDFVQPVRYVDHPHTTGAQAFKYHEQALGIVRRQARGRLVEHQQLGVHGQGAGNGDKGLLRAFKFTDRDIRIDPAVHQGQRRARLAPHFGPVNQPSTAGKAATEGNVLRGAKRVDQAQVLVDEGNASAVGLTLDRPALE